MNTKIKNLALGLKICLIAILIILIIDLFFSSSSGYSEVAKQTGLEITKHTVFVTPIKDSMLQQHEHFTVTGVNALQIQDAKDKYTWHGFFFWVFCVFVAIYGLRMFIRIFKISFLLIRKIETQQLLNVENLPIFKRLGNALLIIGCIEIIASLVMKFYIDFRYSALVGYKVSQPIDFSFNSIILGIVVLIAAAILKETIALKQEQDLTI
jgi:hypothetical protein